MLLLLTCALQVNGVERHLLFVSLPPGADHPQSMEPPPRNVQRCYAHVSDDDDDAGALGASKTALTSRKKRISKGPEGPEQPKKRARPANPTRDSENPTSKHHQMVRDWSDDEAEDLTANLQTASRRQRREEQAGGWALSV